MGSDDPRHVLSCPSCPEGVLEPEDDEWVRCDACDAVVDLRRVEHRCLGGHAIVSPLPADNQVLAGWTAWRKPEAGDEWEPVTPSNREDLAAADPPPSYGWTLCEACGSEADGGWYHEFIYTPGRETISHLPQSPADQADAPSRVDVGILQLLVHGTSRWLSGALRDRLVGRGLSLAYLHGASKIAVSLATGFILALLGPLLGTLTGVDDPQVWFLYVPRALLLGGTLYFSWLVVQETLTLAGELETKMVPRHRFGLWHALRLMVSPKVTLLYFVLAAPVVIGADVAFFTTGTAGLGARTIAALGRLPELFVGVLAAQTFIGLGWVCYFLWSPTKVHPRTGVFEEGFVAGIQSVEKLSQLTVYVLFFITFLMVAVYSLWQLSPGPATVLGLSPAETARIWGAATLATVGAAATVYFTFLGRSVSVWKRNELDLVRERIRATDDAGERADLEAKEQRILDSGRWVVGIEYGARVTLLVAVVVQAVVGLPLLQG